MFFVKCVEYVYIVTRCPGQGRGLAPGGLLVSYNDDDNDDHDDDEGVASEAPHESPHDLSQYDDDEYFLFFCSVSLCPHLLLR